MGSPAPGSRGEADYTLKTIIIGESNAGKSSAFEGRGFSSALLAALRAALPGDACLSPRFRSTALAATPPPPLPSLPLPPALQVYFSSSSQVA